jgi:phospholipid-binding lipoprotein MlaA
MGNRDGRQGEDREKRTQDSGLRGKAIAFNLLVLSPESFSLSRVFLFLCMVLLPGCTNNPVDPFEKTNRVIYNFNNGLDRFVLKPAADGYVKFIPRFIRTGLGNAFDNLEYFNVVLNDFLQGKQGQGWRDFARMAVNSTVGVGGIFDVATGWNLPAHDNSFGNTLGKWGAKAGPYLVLPLFGPSSERDVGNFGTELVTNPVFWLFPPYSVTIPLGATDVIDLRSRNDFIFRFRDQAAIDPYIFTREAYLRYRESIIHEGQPPPDEDFYNQDLGPATQPAK